MKYLRKRNAPDYKIALVAIGLSLFGLAMIASSSVVVAYEKYKGANDYYFVYHQAIALVIGVLAMLFFSNLDYRKFKNISFGLMITTVVLLLIVFLPGIGTSAKGAHRWINLGIFPFQPSEFAKISFIIYLSAWLSSRRDDLERFKKSFLPFLAMLLLISGLIILEPDLGTLSIIILTSMTIFFAAGAPLWNFATLGGFLAFIFAIFVRLEPYRWNRFLTFLNPSSEILGRGYHVNQAFIAVSQGGLWGLGFGNSIQKMRYLPEPHTDSIFAICAEELGFFRSALVIVAYIYLFILGMRISKSAPDNFGRLLALGLIVSLIVQTLINLGAMLGLLPLTGVTLPFISYGGSSLVISFIQIGIILNISRQINYER